ncbi:hypothetical protein [Hyalangium rubrum]|uniref:Lipoprotein n=1 Tax=Hyalangium rubrum TaxID=3103134 RepID=A0ABU5H4Z2_9BACT|nr:hypothetical protein [Hyalangium sp. s54d21]MDY7228557.1 hypothetical protein [Hyalangium sp. s54d21]
MKTLTLLSLGVLMALPPVPVKDMVERAEVVARVDMKAFERVGGTEAEQHWRTTLVPLTVYKGKLTGPMEISIRVFPDVDGGEFTRTPDAGERVAFLRKSGEGWTLVEPRTQALRKATPELLGALGTSDAGPKP